MTERTSYREQDVCLRLMVPAVLALLYLLTFSGQLRSIDEYAMYAGAESIARGTPGLLPQLAFTERHNTVGPFEPGQSMAATPLYILGHRVPGASSVASALLLNVFVTAATGGLLYLLIRRLGYTPSVAVATSLAWGLATTAWPYSRGFFREPLNGCLWVSAALFCVLWSQTRKLHYAALAVLSLTVCLLVKSSSASVLPVFGVALLWDYRSDRISISARTLIAVALAAVVIISVGLYLNRLADFRSLRSVIGMLRQYPARDSLLRAYGALASPLKGLFFYAPVLLATAVGWPALIKTSKLASLIAVGSTLSLFALYGSFVAWHGGDTVWGPRYYVPLLPLLMLPYASAVSVPSLAARIWVAAWTAVGLVVQIAASTTGWVHSVWPQTSAYVDQAIIGIDGTPWYSLSLWSQSPAIRQVLDWEPARLDIAWLRSLIDGSITVDPLLGLGLFALALITAGCLVAALARKRCRASVAALCLLTVAFAAGLVVARSGRNTEDTWGMSRSTAASLVAAVAQPEQSSSVMLYVSNDFSTYFWLGMLKGDYEVHWLSPYADEVSFAQVAEQADGADSIWLVVDRVHMPTDIDANTAREALAGIAFEAGGGWVDDLEVYRFIPPRQMERHSCDADWVNGLQLQSVAYAPQAVTPGEAVLVELELTAREKVPVDYTLFVHLEPVLGGATVPGRDGEPHYGGAPTSSWQPQQPLLEKRAVIVPPGAEAGTYRIVCGWYDSVGSLVPLAAGSADENGQRAVLGSVEVLSDQWTGEQLPLEGSVSTPTQTTP
ncbi:MAG: ArnT family glycosyltransferase [Anaerolineae bacterium]